jgi:hypothetical protein
VANLQSAALDAGDLLGDKSRKRRLEEQADDVYARLERDRARKRAASRSAH